MKALGSVALILFAAAACQPSKPTYLISAPEPTPPPGWVKHEGDGFSFYTPSDWRLPTALEGVDPGSDPGAIANLSNPAVSSGFTPPAQSATAGATMTLVNPSYRNLPGETGTFILLKKETQGGTASLTGETDKSVAAIPRSTKSEITLPCGPATEVSSSVKTKTGDASHQIMFVMVNGKDVYRLHLMTAQDGSVIKDIARPIAETFRVSKPDLP